MEELTTLEAMARRIVQEFGGRARDLVDLGYPSAAAKRYVGTKAEPAPWGARPPAHGESIEVPVGVAGAADPTVALVPLSGSSRELAKAAQGFYWRWEELAQPVPLAAAAIGWSENDHVTDIRRVDRRLRVTGRTIHTLIGDGPDPQSHGDSVFQLFFLGERVAEINLQLGFGGERPQGLPGVQIYRQGQLQEGTLQGRTLKQIPTIKPGE